MEDSNVVTFTYIIDRMAKNEHKNRLLYDEAGMKVWNICIFIFRIWTAIR